MSHRADSDDRTLSVPPRSASAWRFILAGALPPLIALAVALLFLSPIAPWLIFNLAVIVSARLGGLKSGLVATILSTVLIWYFFIPPVRSFVVWDRRHMDAALVFLAIGVVISFMFDRLESATREVEQALGRAKRSNGELQRTNLRLEESRLLLRSVIDYSPGIVVVKDLEGKLLLFNRRFEETLGLPAEELRGQTVYNLFPADAGERRRKADQTVIQTRAPITLEETLELPDGRHHFLASAFPLSDPRGTLFGVCWIETDITDKKRAEVGLKESQQLCQSVIDHSPGIIVVKDLEGKLLLFNRSFERNLGLSRDQLHGRTVYDLFSSEVAKHRRRTDQTVIRTHSPVTLEETVQLSDGRHVFLASAFPLDDANDSLYAVCWIETDITERKRAEDELQRTASDLAEAQRVGHIGSWSWEVGAEGLVWSDEMYHLHGWDSHLPAPRLADLPRLYCRESADAVIAAIDRTATDGTPYELLLETTQPEGSPRWITDRGEPERDSVGRIVRVHGIAQDVTRLKELERLREEWISVIAHDLRQPIGAIKMASQLLPDLHTGKMSDEEATITARVGSAADSLERMVEDLLDVSRLETNRLSLDRSWVDPRVLVRETIERLSHVTHGYEVSIADDANAPEHVFADAVRVQQVLGNLISNAAKYGEANGEIRVGLTSHDTELDFAVTNRGHGISPEDVSRLFTRFGRLKDAESSGVQGLGLGLYIAKGLVEAHGGRMWVDSVPNETTTFHFTLPADGRANAAE
jgi:PAS domain S-box-containing protein